METSSSAKRSGIYELDVDSYNYRFSPHFTPSTLSETSVKIKVIKLNKHEIQSNSNRVTHAEGLIEQLPEGHEGRNAWLLNYGIRGQACTMRQVSGDNMNWDTETSSLHLLGSGKKESSQEDNLSGFEVMHRAMEDEDIFEVRKSSYSEKWMSPRRTIQLNFTVHNFISSDWSIRKRQSNLEKAESEVLKALIEVGKTNTDALRNVLSKYIKD